MNPLLTSKKTVNTQILLVWIALKDELWDLWCFDSRLMIQGGFTFGKKRISEIWSLFWITLWNIDEHFMNMTEYFYIQSVVKSVNANVSLNVSLSFKGTRSAILPVKIRSP